MSIARKAISLWLLGSALACTGVVGELGTPLADEGTPGGQTDGQDDGQGDAQPAAPQLAAPSDGGTSTFNPDPENAPPTVATFRCAPATGVVPFTVACLVDVADADDAAALGCSLFVEGPSPAAKEGVPCQGTLEHEVLTVGAHVLTLQAKDGKDALASRSFTVQATETPNLPPVVDTFTVVAPPGAVPVTASFSWKVSDPEGLPLTCELDVGEDGSVEVTVPDCQTTSQASHTFTTEGTHKVRLRVRDPRAGLADKSVSLSVRRAVGDVVVGRVEFGQSVFAQNPKLVDGKPVYLRVAAYSPAALQNVKLQVEAVSAAGAVVGTQALTGPATLPTTEPVTSLAQSFTGTLPGAWMKPGVELRIRVDPEDAIPETDEANNVRSLKPNVGRGTVLPLTVVPVVQQNLRAVPPNFTPNVLAQWPLREIVSTVRAPYTFGAAVGATTNWENLLTDLATLRRTDGSNQYYYGFVRVNYGSGIAGIGFQGQPIAAGRDDSIDTMVHELGHNFGLPHAPCGGPADPDPNFPYAGARIGNPGFDSVTQRLVPATYFDIMSYCEPSWVSDYNYGNVYTFLEQRPPPAVASASTAPMILPMILVRGTVDGDRVELAPVHRLLAAESVDDTLEAGGPRLRVTVSGEHGTREVNVALLEPSHPGPRHFVALLPDVGAVRAVEVAAGERPLFRRVLTRLLLPAFGAEVSESQDRLAVRWDALACPHAAVAHLGETRTTLALGLTGGAAELSVERLPAGGVFEVSCSDGLSSQRWEFAR